MRGERPEGRGQSEGDAADPRQEANDDGRDDGNRAEDHETATRATAHHGLRTHTRRWSRAGIREQRIAQLDRHGIGAPDRDRSTHTEHLLDRDGVLTVPSHLVDDIRRRAIVDRCPRERAAIAVGGTDAAVTVGERVELTTRRVEGVTQLAEDAEIGELRGLPLRTYVGLDQLEGNNRVVVLDDSLNVRRPTSVSTAAPVDSRVTR